MTILFKLFTLYFKKIDDSFWSEKVTSFSRQISSYIWFGHYKVVTRVYFEEQVEFSI